MDFIFIFGPQAVGKMSVGQKMEESSGLRLIHNHLTIDLARSVYHKGDPVFVKFLTRLNYFTFRHIIDYPPSKGIIYTEVWQLNNRAEMHNKLKMFELFNTHGWNIHVLELKASLQTRLERNRTANRLFHKPSKHNIKLSERFLLQSDQRYLLNSEKCASFELPEYIANHIVINTDEMKAKDVAIIGLNKFKIENNS